MIQPELSEYNYDAVRYRTVDLAKGNQRKNSSADSDPDLSKDS
jgi:hypothetical protein